MSEKHGENSPRTSDSELLSETMPQSVEKEKQNLLAESDFLESHTTHLERGYQISEIKESLISVEKTAEETQRKIDETNESISIKEQKILTRIFDFVKIIKLKQHLSSSESARKSQQEEVTKIKDELSALENLHQTEKAQLNLTVIDFLKSEEVNTEATGIAIETKKAELESIRAARDVSAMSEKEDCLVFHTLMPKGYIPGTTFKTAPTDNSPLDYEVAAASGVRLIADITLGYDIELSCCTLREGSKDTIWPGAGGFIIGGGSVRMAADQDMATSVDSETGRRSRPNGSGASGEAGLHGRKDNFVRNEEDLHFAIAGKGRDVPGNHNELVVESPDISGVFINIAPDAQVIFWDEAMRNEFMQEDTGYNSGSYLAESSFQDIIDISKQNELPIYAMYKGEAFKVGPSVQRVKTRGVYSTPNRLPFKEITLIPGVVSFEEIRGQETGVTDDNKQAAKDRVPLEVFK
ncbi:MAG: hypothetical protein WCP14_00165 [bacterium]